MCNCNKPLRPTRTANNTFGPRQILRFSAPQSSSNIIANTPLPIRQDNSGEALTSERRRIESIKRKAALQKHLGR